MSENQKPNRMREKDYQDLGTALGLLFGGILGVVIWIATESFVFFPVYTGGGLAAGVTIGESWKKEQE